MRCSRRESCSRVFTPALDSRPLGYSYCGRRRCLQVPSYSPVHVTVLLIDSTLRIAAFWESPATRASSSITLLSDFLLKYLMWFDVGLKKNLNAFRPSEHVSTSLFSNFHSSNGAIDILLVVEPWCPLCCGRSRQCARYLVRRQIITYYLSVQFLWEQNIVQNPKFFDKVFLRIFCRQRFRNGLYGGKILLMGKCF